MSRRRHRRSADAPLTFALCASLAVHALLALLFVREQIAVLTGQLKRPPLVAALPEQKEAEPETPEAPQAIVLPPETALPDELAKDPPLPLPPPDVVKP